MSQASKQKAQRLVREREQVARFIAVVSPVSPPPIVQQDRGYRPRGKVGMLMAGGGFDAHAAREAALTLVALEAEHAVFEDWCRARGKGPENREPYAFKTSARIYHRANGEPVVYEEDERGGWPGNLAREYAWDRCPNKCQPFMNLDEVRPRGYTTLSDGSVSRSYTATPGEWRRFYAHGVADWDGDWTGRDIVQCVTCTDGRVRHGDRDPRAPMGRRLAKLGRAVIRALDGQPSECQRLDCEDGYIDGLAPTDELPGGIPCPDCHGTGHNLRGVLPPVECQPQLLRRMHEDEGGYHDDTMAPWIVALGQTPMLRPVATPGPIDEAEPAISHVDALELMGPDGVDDRTRVVARGLHRMNEDLGGGVAVGLDCTSDERITAKGWGGPWWRHGPTVPTDHEVPLRQGEQGPRRLVKRHLVPRWRRGELRHAEQRAARRLRYAIRVGQQTIGEALAPSFEAISQALAEQLSNPPW